MKTNTIEHIVKTAISEYLHDLQGKNNEITVALTNRLPPLGLEELLLKALKEQIKLEKNKHIKRLYHEQMDSQASLLEINHLTIEEVKNQIQQNTATLQETNKSLKALQDESLVYATNYEAETEPEETNSYQEYIDNNDYAHHGSERQFLLGEAGTFSNHCARELIKDIVALYRYDGTNYYPSETYYTEIKRLTAKMYWGREMRALEPQIANATNKITELERTIGWLKGIDGLGSPTRDCKAMKAMLTDGSHKEYLEIMSIINKEYDYSSFSKTKIRDIFSTFADYLIPQIQAMPEFENALKKYALETKHEDNLTEKKTAIVTLLESKIAQIGIGQIDKQIRVMDLKARMSAITISQDSSANDLVKTINTWSSDFVRGKRNSEVFQPGFFGRFFACKPNTEALFIQQCLDLARERPAAANEPVLNSLMPTVM